MAWTLDEFYSTGGPTTFSDNVAGVLGIHASQIKVVSVYEGSVVVDFTVEDVDDEEEEEEEVATAGFQASTVDVEVAGDEAIDVTDGEEVVLLTAQEKLAMSMEKLKTMIAENDVAFGAPVLSASINEPGKETEDVKLDPSWTPPFSRLRRFTQKPKEEIPCIEDDYVCENIACEVVEDRYDGSICTKIFCTNEVCGKDMCHVVYTSELYPTYEEYGECYVETVKLREVFDDSIHYSMDTWCPSGGCVVVPAAEAYNDFQLDYEPAIDAALQSEEVMGLLDEINDDVAEGFGENEVLDVLS